MKSLVSMLVCVFVIAGALSSEVSAAPTVQRQGSENPVIEVAKSTLLGALGGLALGGALALVSSGDNDGEIVRWSFVGGTLIGFGYGIYHVSTRPKTTALLEFQGGSPSLHVVIPAPEPGRGMTLRLVSATF